MSALGSIPNQQEMFLQDSIDFLTCERDGHTGRWTYDENWPRFVRDNPFYHVFNEECGLFALNAESLAERTSHLKAAVDLGAGSRDAFIRKILVVLARMPELNTLISIDLCEAFPAATAEVVDQWMPSVKLNHFNTDFSIQMPVLADPVLAFYVGSSISNIVLQPQESLAQGIGRTLNWFANALPAGSMLAISYDSCHDRNKIFRAYRHPAFETMERGLIGRMNRELGLTGITPDDFSFVGEWYPERHLFSNELKARHAAQFTLRHITGQIEAGQRFWSGSCYKPTDAIMNAAVSMTPFEPVARYPGPNMRLLLLKK